jgi:hypothetical protein
MANRTCYEVQALGKEVKIISAVVRITGAASAANNIVVVEPSNVGKTTINGIASVARTAAGTITITLADRWVGLEGVSVAYAPHNGGARDVNLGAIDVVTNRTVVVRTINASLVATDTPNTEIDRIYLTLFLKNSSVQ